MMDLDLQDIRRVRIRPTLDRSTFKPGYFIVVSPEAKKALGLGRWAALVFVHPALTAVQDDKKKRDYIAVHCRVHVDKTRASTAEFVDGVHVVCIDQTLRNALGIPYGLFRELCPDLPLYLFPAERSWSAGIRLAVASLFGVRFLAARAATAAVPDIEKGYVRLPDDLLSVIAAVSADNVVVERPVAIGAAPRSRFQIISEHMSTATASSGFLADRMTRSQGLEPTAPTMRDRILGPREQQAISRRYPNTTEILYRYKSFVDAKLVSPDRAKQHADDEMIETDLPPIFMDYDLRHKGLPQDNPDDGADYLTPFMVRRSILSAAARDSLATAFALTVSLIQFAFYFADKTKLDRGDLLLGIGVALGVSGLLMLCRLRQQV